jgi:hypothetical protein
MVQLAPGAIGVSNTQVVAEIAKGPVGLMDEIVRLAARLFVKVTVCVALAEPTATLPKFKLPGNSVAGVTPVPESVTTCGLLPALS